MWAKSEFNGYCFNDHLTHNLKQLGWYVKSCCSPGVAAVPVLTCFFHWIHHPLVIHLASGTRKVPTLDIFGCFGTRWNPRYGISSINRNIRPKICIVNMCFVYRLFYKQYISPHSPWPHPSFWHWILKFESQTTFTWRTLSALWVPTASVNSNRSNLSWSNSSSPPGNTWGNEKNLVV